MIYVFILFLTFPPHWQALFLLPWS